MRNVRHGQVSFEFLMVTAVALTVLTASTYFLFAYTQNTTDQTAILQTAQIGYKVIDTASTVYVHGEGSFITVTSNLPEQVRSVYVVDEKALVFELETNRGVVSVQVFSKVPINGSVANGQEINVNPSGTFVHSGRTEYVVTSQGSWVKIEQKS